MRLDSGKILEINITISPKEKILEEIKKYLKYAGRISETSRHARQKPLTVVTPNPEQIVLAQKETQFAKLLNRADISLPDGIGIVWASRYLRDRLGKGTNAGIPARIPGIEFMENLTALAAKQGFRIGLIGGRDGLAVQALECLRRSYPRLDGWAVDGPDMEQERVLRYPARDWSGESETGDRYFVRLATHIAKTGTRFVFVGLGAPKQEYFIARLRAHCTTSVVLMSVGGSFDMVTGRLRRAPLLIRLIGFEWFWRLVQEPWRWRRQLALLQFAVSVLRARSG